ncbi:hypothetical protein Q5752_005554 [Cryptotrichosporon argae]
MSSSPKKKAPQPSGRVVDPITPVQVALAWALVVLFPDVADPPPVSSTAHVAGVLQLIALEAFEVSDGRLTFDALCRQLDRLYAKERRAARRRNDKLRARGQPVPLGMAAAEEVSSRRDEFLAHFAQVSDGCAFIGAIEREVRNRISESTDELPDTPEPLDRRSPLGLYFRQLALALRRLSFAETSALAAAVAQWAGLSPGPSAPAWARPVAAAPAGLRVNSTVERREQAMVAYEQARDSGDYSGALAAMRRFYDYQPPSPASAQSQRVHALLSLASFHYATGGLDAARSVIEEAIRNARSQGESQCLQQCMSIYHRLTTETNVPILSTDAPRVAQALEARLPKAATAADDLWLLQAALDLGEPVHVAFRRVYAALSRLDVFADGKDDKERNWDRDFDFGAWHATQARLWGMLGSDTLAQHHWAQAGDAPGTRLGASCARADKAADTGDFESALSALLEWDTVRGMAVDTYHAWTEAVWALLERRARLAQDDESLTVIARARPPAPTRAGPGAPARVQSSTRLQTVDAVRAALDTVLERLDAHAPVHLVLPRALLALQLAADLSLWPVYRQAAVALAECLVRIDAADAASKAAEVVDGVADALTDEETRARAELVRAQVELARALDADADGPSMSTSISTGAWDAAVAHLDRAEAHARAARARALVCRSLQLRALVADARGEDAAEVMRAWEAEGAGADADGADETRRVVALVGRVGVRVAQGWA